MLPIEDEPEVLGGPGSGPRKAGTERGRDTVTNVLTKATGSWFTRGTDNSAKIPHHGPIGAQKTAEGAILQFERRGFKRTSRGRLVHGNGLNALVQVGADNGVVIRVEKNLKAAQVEQILSTLEQAIVENDTEKLDEILGTRHAEQVREPAGSPKGGQFASSGESGKLSIEEHNALVKYASLKGRLTAEEKLHLNRAVLKGPVFHGSIFRGISNLEPAVAKGKATIGHEFSTTEPTSFSSDIEVSKGWAHTEVDKQDNEFIHYSIENSDVGTSIEKASDYPESEILVPAGVAYRVIKSTPSKGIYGTKGYEVVLERIRAKGLEANFRTLADSVDFKTLDTEGSEHPFTYCMDVVVPAIEAKGKPVSDPKAFCGWWKAERALELRTADKDAGGHGSYKRSEQAGDKVIDTWAMKFVDFWKSGGGTFYHGTTSEALASIKEYGLTPGGGEGADSAVEMFQQFNAGDRKLSVYMVEEDDFAKNEAIASGFADTVAKIHPGSTPVVLAIRIPAKHRDRIVKDEKSVGSAAVRLKIDRIPPEWIQVLTNPRRGDIGRRRGVKQEFATLAEGDTTIIAMFAVDNEALEALDEHNLETLSSGNFGHEGRPGQVGGSASTKGGDKLAKIEAQIDRLQNNRPKNTASDLEWQSFHEKLQGLFAQSYLLKEKGPKETTPLPSSISKATKELYSTAKEAGEKAYGVADSKLGSLEFSNAHSKPVKIHINKLDEESDTIDDYEYVFFPSTPGAKAIGALDSNRIKNSSIRDSKKKIVDKDGNIYLYHPENGIRIIRTAEEFGLEDLGEHNFSSIQVNLPPNLAEAVYEFGMSIPDDELAEDGREETAHITVKYGLHTNDVKDVTAVLDFSATVSIILGKTAIFVTPDYDVLIIEVDSPDLYALNELISDRLEVTDTHPEYHPHVTIAYLKSGMGGLYAGDDTFEGQVATFDELVFSPAEGEEEILRVAEDARALKSGNWGHSGRKGQVGGSSKGDSGGNSGGVDWDRRMAQVINTWVEGNEGINDEHASKSELLKKSKLYQKMRDPNTKEGKEVTEMLGTLDVYDGVAYRGMILDDKSLKKLTRAGGTVLFDCHSSSSKIERVANEFIRNSSKKGNKVLIELHGKAADLSDLVSKEYISEKEVVVKAGTKYKMKQVVDEAKDLTRVILQEVS
jgi:2'-5' RNA ligase